MTEAASRRVFFALWPDGPSLDALDALAEAGAVQCGGRRMRRDALHITLAFIGAAAPDRLAALREAAACVRAAPFDLTMDRLGYWPRNRILWVGCSEVPSGQRRLFAQLSEALIAQGFELDPRPHVPHVTLVRNARCTSLPSLKMPIRWSVEAFALVESCLQPEGARYQILATWPLLEKS